MPLFAFRFHESPVQAGYPYLNCQGFLCLKLFKKKSWDTLQKWKMPEEEKNKRKNIVLNKITTPHFIW